MDELVDREFHGPNIGYIQELYDVYLRDPESLDEETRNFFENWTPPGPAVSDQAALCDPTMMVEVVKFIRSIREYGHRAARIDPLGSEPPGDPALDSRTYGITDEDLAALPPQIIGGPVRERVHNGLEGARELWNIYCGTTGYDFGHIHSSEERLWLRDAVDSRRFQQPLEDTKARALLERLTRVEAFERFLHRTYMGQKRFSIEGTDMLVPMLEEIIQRAADAGVRGVMMGMAHRGRLNVLAHVMQKPYWKIFSEFQDVGQTRSTAPSESYNEGWAGDVKYHLGTREVYKRGETAKVLLVLSPNPSHLEHVDPIIEGMVRAAQEDRRWAGGAPVQDEQSTLGILMHGDAAFPGQGIVAETLNLSQLPGYKTGGTIHIIVNNQLGFTTEVNDARSTLYASDLAKGFEIPVVHVNADDAEACLAAVRLAHAYRDRFHKDFLIDLVGYRRWGHNEGDEPSYTQPLMYNRIRNHPGVKELWAQELTRRGVVTPEEAGSIEREAYDNLQSLWQARNGHAKKTPMARSTGSPAKRNEADTRVPADRLMQINEELLRRPPGFTPHAKLERLIQRSRGGLNEQSRVDWAHAETLAFATILTGGTAIRLTGQDTERGTFSQRHLTLYDVNSGEEYTPLEALPDAKASFAVYNSPLSEPAVLGFEYGYSLYAPGALVLWEAQFGDFVNVAQAIIDEFIVSGRTKWRQDSALVLLLPHGYEGQGPEHSSARPERFLSLAAEDNLRIVNCTTAAQYFHLLRRQAALLERDPRPLIVMAPKSLLRNPRASSPLTALSEGSFQVVIDDESAADKRSKIRRLLFCTGKVYYDLVSSEACDLAKDVALIRVEELYPFPKERVRQVLESYPNLEEAVWVQEEPRNMGAWGYMEPRMRQVLPEGLELQYAGRPPMSSPAEGSGELHVADQACVIEAAFERSPRAQLGSSGRMRNAG